MGRLVCGFQSYCSVVSEQYCSCSESVSVSTCTPPALGPAGVAGQGAVLTSARQARAPGLSELSVLLGRLPHVVMADGACNRCHELPTCPVPTKEGGSRSTGRRGDGSRVRLSGKMEKGEACYGQRHDGDDRSPRIVRPGRHRRDTINVYVVRAVGHPGQRSA